MNVENKEVKKFDAEVGKVLNLMINSIYTNKEIFLRELIANSSDACDKLRYFSQQDDKLIEGDSQLKIKVILDRDQKTITILDNGIGMNKNDLIENLGTIAKSGTEAFLSKLSGDQKKDSLIIGQFGVGFYSSFMVADKVVVYSRKAGENKAYNWESDGKGEYNISEFEDELNRGTKVILHIKESEDSYLDPYRIKHIIKTYSDHISVPIFFVENKTATEDSKTNEEDEKALNSSSALWTRPKSEITDEQYKEFYRTISHSPDEPWLTMHNKNEGLVEFINLLFIPSSKTFDLFHPDRKCKVKLYIKRVFIGDENIDIVPKYLRFIRGIVDCADLPLNISRETLQNNRQLEQVKNLIAKKIISELKKKLLASKEDYLSFWKNFGSVLKEGLCEMGIDSEKLIEVCMFTSAKSGSMISVDQYIEEAKDGNKSIYYLSGDNVDKLRDSPHIENLLDQGIDVLLFTDAVDDFWVNLNYKYKEYEFKSVTKYEQEESENEKNKDSDVKDVSNSTYEELINYFKSCLGDKVQDVKISKRLKSSPVCLTAASGGMDMKMERFLIEQKQLEKASAKILELNVDHPIIQKINNNITEKKANLVDSNIEDCVHILYYEACIGVGEAISDPSSFIKRMNNIVESNIRII